MRLIKDLGVAVLVLGIAGMLVIALFQIDSKDSSGKLNIETSSEMEESVLNSELNLEDGIKYKVLEKTELIHNSFSEEVYTGKYSYHYVPNETQIMRFTLEDLETGKRVYSRVVSDCYNVSDEYKSFSCLLVGDVLEFNRNTYTLVLDK